MSPLIWCIWTSLWLYIFTGFRCSKKWFFLCTFSVSSLWFCCIGFSVCNFMRLMTLSHTCEASLTKIQQHNVHSIFVSFFPIQKAFQSALGHLESLLVLATAQRWCQCWRGNVFAKQMEKHHCVAHTQTHTHFPLGDFTACIDIQSFITKWINVPELQFPLKNRCRRNI